MNVYYVPHVQAVGGPLTAGQLGARWLAQHQGEGTPLILVPTTRQATNNDGIRYLVEHGVGWVIPRNFPPSGWQGGPVLAPWANEKVLEAVDQWSARITSVCVLKWLEDDAASWLAARGAQDATSPGGSPVSATISDPVVEAAMREITEVINLGNDLLQGNDRTDTIRRLQYLAGHGHALVPSELEAWALANGWSMAGATRLREVATRINGGRSFRGLDYGPIRDRGAMLRRWKDEAGAKGD